MTILVEGVHAGEFLLSEANGTLSREQVTFDAAAPAMGAGTVVAKIAATGEWVAYDNAAVGGTGGEVAAGILYAALPETAVDQKGVVIVRQAEVAGALLTGLDATGITDLAALGIVVR